jgi:hypothetical protein
MNNFYDRPDEPSNFEIIFTKDIKGEVVEKRFLFEDVRSSFRKVGAGSGNTTAGFNVVKFYPEFWEYCSKHCPRKVIEYKELKMLVDNGTVNKMAKITYFIGGDFYIEEIRNPSGDPSSTSISWNNNCIYSIEILDK